jgi:hypothetical protein
MFWHHFKPYLVPVTLELEVQIPALMQFVSIEKMMKIDLWDS